MKKVIFNYKNNPFLIRAKECSGMNKFSGLMFKDNNYSTPLLFKINNYNFFSIHSFFVPFSFIALWINKDDNLIKWHIISPFSFALAPKGSFKLIEIPLNSDNEKILKKLRSIS